MWLQPDIALNSWRGWNANLNSRPVILNVLCGGRSNCSLLIDSDGQKMVLRLNGTDSILPNASRQQEFTIWQAASDCGIAPRLIHVDQQNQFLVSNYIENLLPSKHQPNQAYINQAFGLLERCHRLTVQAPSLDYFKHIEHYWNIIKAKNHLADPELIKQHDSMFTQLEALINSRTPTGLCHHDPVIANFVGRPERLYLIDWEYAANGLQIMDYAALATEWEIDDTTILKRTAFRQETLIKAKALYGYLCRLWEEARV